MKVGDKIEILKTGRIGIIIGEGSGVWKVDFLDGDKPENISKDTPMNVLSTQTNPNPSPNPRPKKRWGWKRWLWTIGIILFIVGALYLTVRNSI